MDSEPFVEVDPSGRYRRFSEALDCSGAIQIYKAVDQEKGIFVSWHKIEFGSSSVDPNRLQSELSLVKSVDSKNVITTYKVWRDKSQNALNFITELCSSGNLKELQQWHTQISIRTRKKWAKQILKGLHDLHTHNPCIVHGDLKSSNVFINDTIGQVKIGGMGLAAIQSQNDLNLQMPKLEGSAQDIYMYGLLVAELVAPGISYAEYDDPVAQAFIRKCIGATMAKPTAAQLLLDRFFKETACDDKENKGIPQKSKFYWTWRMKLPYILDMPFTQSGDTCWAVALARAVSALRKIHGYPDGIGMRPVTYRDLIKNIPQRYICNAKGGIVLTESSRDFLVGEGIVSDMVVHHRPKSDNLEENEEFERLIQRLLNKSPVLVSVVSYPSYRSSSDGKGIITPTDEEMGRYDYEEFTYHSMLLTGHGKDEHNREFWEFQDSYGKDWGDNGFVLYAKHKRLIEEVVELKL